MGSWRNGNSIRLLTCKFGVRIPAVLPLTVINHFMTKLKFNEDQLTVLAAILFHVRMGGDTPYAKAASDIILDNEEILEASEWEDVVLKLKKNDYGDREIVIKN